MVNDTLHGVARLGECGTTTEYDFLEDGMAAFK